ncbi:MAG: efflux RND transporter periplasmic adaptor subunit [Methylococcaceae bacterium]|nr:efflux RND transporter periplasmic adaptor subunit [Methylococcaceae bacterium]
MKKIMLGLALIAISALAYSYWPQANGAQDGGKYKTQVLALGDVTQSVSANGTLNPVRMVQVGTQVSGTVRRLHVDFNDQVEKGQVLLELDDALYAAQLRQSSANLANVEASLALAIANEKRMQGLAKDEYITRQEFDQVVQARKSAAAMVDQARAAVEKDRVNLAYTVIRSPVSGVVVERLVDVGQTVAANFQTPTLIRIAQDLTKMQIDSSFAESDIGGIKVGQTVRFSVDAFPNETFSGNVVQIRLSPTIDQNVVTYDVVIAVDNSTKLLFPGMTAYVNIAVQERGKVLLVPNAALRYKPNGGKNAQGAKKSAGRDGKKPAAIGGGLVHILESDGQLRPVSVTVGITDNRMTEIVSGELKEGDVVVTGENGEGDGRAGASQKPAPMRLF